MPNYAACRSPHVRQPSAVARNNVFTNNIIGGSPSPGINGLAQTVIQNLLGGGSSLQGNGLGQTVIPDLFSSDGSGSSGFDFSTTDFGSSGIGGLGDLTNNLNFF